MTWPVSSQAETNSAEETRSLGEQLGRQLVPGDVVALVGDLGSGKTCLIQGICRGLGVRAVVNSPSYTIVNEYTGRCPVYHLDFYRLRGRDDLLALGYEEYFYGDGICLIEWAERAVDLLPPQRVEVHLERRKGNRRKIAIEKVDEHASSGGGNGHAPGLSEPGG
jgi:tRNA threonylcarbamoyladenosine biosynthesis protein TsaE